MLLSDLLTADFADVDREAGDKLDAVARKAADTDRKGKVVLTFAVEKLKSRVIISVAAVETLPKDDPESALFFVHPGKGLTKDDPWQTSLDHIDPATGEVIDPNAPATPNPAEG